MRALKKNAGLLILLLAIVAVFSIAIHENASGKPLAVERHASIMVPAVDTDKKGSVSTISVQIVPGKGRTLADINNVLFFVDTQNSIRTARSVASQITGMDLSGLDIIVDIDTSASAIEGPSAGAALTIATIAALEGKQIKDDVMITGSMQPDGSVGGAGGIEMKLAAAKDAGIKTFIVPTENFYEEFGFMKKIDCKQLSGYRYCQTDYVPSVVDKSESLGLNIASVSNISEALHYFIE